ncbi:DUF2189 domain-containing protein [Vogesella sp. DC21W]|uniref:DUF2189 domain-containing protein n=1 Tax=Vogesella aquatica TaxID=2984206 RepID=A0ABT5IXU0_9NEIS|nr:DUF2189 domain-containing protein [Vogesella aquatica]MDC7717384.1 DUF2189 domain-containing protein [Vogesella aquatica]
MTLLCLATQQHIVVQRQGLAAPFRWLKLGWRDLQRTPADALLYGAVYVLMAYGLAYLLQYFPELALALGCACWLLGPFLAAGLYDIARQQQAFNGGRVMLLHSALAWRANPGALALYGCVMALLSCAWGACSMLLFALFDQGRLPRLDALLPGLLQGDNLLLSLSWVGMSLLFVLLVLSLSICTCAMLLDKEIDVITAMQASLQVVGRNGVTMVVWAAMIVALVAIGLASQFVGLLLVAPLLGLSSWHAYRALISYEC